MVTKEKKYLGLVSDNIFFIKIFNDIGLKSSYIGYYYLIAIMDMLINKEFKAKSFCKNIYPVVAKLFNKSVCTVERDIRILIDSCCLLATSICNLFLYL